MKKILAVLAIGITTLFLSTQAFALGSSEKNRGDANMGSPCYSSSTQSSDQEKMDTDKGSPSDQEQMDIDNGLSSDMDQSRSTTTQPKGLTDED